MSEDKSEHKSSQTQLSGHYWWCPLFGHMPSCQYLNYGFQDYWSPMMSNPYGVPFHQMPPNFDQNKRSVQSRKRSRSQDKDIAKKSRKSGSEIERLYSCRLCDQLKETEDLSTLRRHIEDHLGKNGPFVCQVCTKTFKFRSNCRNHIIAHSVVRKHYHRVSAPTLVHSFQ